MNDDRTRVTGRGSAVSIGTELNQVYRIDSPLGIGGMGEVYRGHNIQTGDPVAIKIVLPEFAEDETILGLFRKEARILNHLYHEAIVRYYVFSIDPKLSRPYLAMEYVDGPSLAAHVKDAPLTASEFMPLLRRLADGLHRAHLAGVIHRDMSPDNVILPGGLVENAKIIDFGIARSANVGGETLLGSSFAGKYNFVSPEQVGLYGSQVTPKADVYSLALVMAAAMRGKPLDMGGSPVEVVEKRHSVPDLDGVPKQFHAVLTAMLTSDPSQRPDMAAVRDWPDAAPSAEAPPGKQKAAVWKPVEAVPIRLSNRARTTIFSLIAVAVVCIGALGGWIFVKGNISGSDVVPTSPQATRQLPEELPPTSPGSADQKTIGQDIAALQAFIDRCGADCSQEFIKEAQRRIDALKQRTALRDRLAKELSAPSQDLTALQKLFDQCGADCPNDLAERARSQIDALKQQAALHDRLANQLAAAGQDRSALQSFLDQCGVNCPSDLTERARQQIDILKQKAELHDRLASQLAAASGDLPALQRFLDQCDANCPSDLTERARRQIDVLKQQAALHDRLANQLAAAGQDPAALQGFLDQCGSNCPSDLAERARSQIDTLKQKAELHDRLASQLAAAGQNLAALQRFLDQCGANCPIDLAKQAGRQIETLKQQAAFHDRLASQLSTAGRNIPALQSFIDQCGTDCPNDLAQRAREQIEALRKQAALHDRLTDKLSAAGGDITGLQGFLEECGVDCPGDLARQAQERLDTLKQQAALRDRLARQLDAAGQDAAALQRFLDQCGADCPDDLLGAAKARLASAAAAHPPAPASAEPVDIDQRDWDAVKTSNSATAVQSYIASHQNSRFNAEATKLLASLTPSPAPARPAPAANVAERHRINPPRPKPRKRVAARPSNPKPVIAKPKAPRPAAKCFTFSGSTFCE